ncbi:MAG: hypothetical protein IJE63_01490 [Clostridia bacterium]|nr:hypothetical protein [Clostridia bacterium]
MRNFNKAAAVMLAVLMLAAVIPFSANAFEREGDFYYSVIRPQVQPQSVNTAERLSM